MKQLIPLSVVAYLLNTMLPTSYSTVFIGILTAGVATVLVLGKKREGQCF